ncbi:MAG: hypothetical protein KatS3mg131_2312 [Candidatus Tectimicrobiota bacterium]|nr:MAG: hypothetical protein KatS3mg131_2312 [Candidatus Tectomicrobia bacterium]
MKFVCTECDEQMRFAESGGIDADGSLAVTFRCPSCDWGVTLLTNPQETQLVRALGVKIGGRAVPPRPMEMLQSHLLGAAAPAEAPAPGGGGCPFAALVEQASAAAELRWSAEATARLERLPSFVRPMVRQGIEAFARERGYGEVTPQVMDEARAHLGL